MRLSPVTCAERKETTAGRQDLPLLLELTDPFHECLQFVLRVEAKRKLAVLQNGVRMQFGDRSGQFVFNLPALIECVSGEPSGDIVQPAQPFVTCAAAPTPLAASHRSFAALLLLGNETL